MKKELNKEQEEADFISGIEKVSAELSKKRDCEVTPIIIEVKGEKIVGYFQEPSVDIILYSQDKFLEKKYSDAEEATFRDCLLIEESDPRISSEERKNGKIRASFMVACAKMVIPYKDEYKKK